jgi:hypothetical protein
MRQQIYHYRNQAILQKTLTLRLNRPNGLKTGNLPL